MGSNYIFLCFFNIISLVFVVKGVFGLGINWGLQATHPLPPKIVVKLLKENGFDKVKLFEADPAALMALGKTGIQVMVGIPNDFLASFASNWRNADVWVQQNVSTFISQHGVDIRYVAVGNEPFLKTYKDQYMTTTFPALQNVQAALIKAGLGRQVKATIPLNADVYQSEDGLPSNGNFRTDIHDLMISIVQFLDNNGAPFTVNIYPFLSLYADPNFPIEYAFFDNNSTSPIVDGSITYTNVFDANFDTLISALERNNFTKIPVIIGEVGWPTDGDSHANPQSAQRFNQGLINRIISQQGTPRRKTPPEIYVFGLLDEDNKSTAPGNFERHWGLFNYDGSVKYNLNTGNTGGLVAAKGVRYLARQWCIMSPQADVTDVTTLASAVDYACSYADCTSLGFGSSCGQLDAQSNVSYAFNMYYQTMDQRKGACSFNNLSVVTSVDPSQDSCRFEIQIDLKKQSSTRRSHRSSSTRTKQQSPFLSFILLFVLFVLYLLA
ncbi:hypothetical protein ACFE04_016305 [Oxalis oulophora]